MNYLRGDQPKFAEIIAREPIVVSAGMDRATKSSLCNTEWAWGVGRSRPLLLAATVRIYAAALEPTGADSHRVQ